MKTLTNILKEQNLNLNNTEKAIIASMAISATEHLAYGVVHGARNAVTAGEELKRTGYIRINHENKTASLTDKGTDILTSENLIDDAGELTDRGEDLISHYRVDRGEWKKFESFKYLS